MRLLFLKRDTLPKRTIILTFQVMRNRKELERYVIQYLSSRSQRGDNSTPIDAQLFPSVHVREIPIEAHLLPSNCTLIEAQLNRFQLKRNLQPLQQCAAGSIPIKAQPLKVYSHNISFEMHLHASEAQCA